MMMQFSPGCNRDCVKLSIEDYTPAKNSTHPNLQPLQFDVQNHQSITEFHKFGEYAELQILVFPGHSLPSGIFLQAKCFCQKVRMALM